MSVAQFGVLGSVVGAVWFAVIAAFGVRARARES
jgi:hypothetical protein